MAGPLDALGDAERGDPHLDAVPGRDLRKLLEGESHCHGEFRPAGRAVGHLCQGEITQLRHTYDTARTEASYLASIEGKTAALFATAARIGGIVAGFDRPMIDTLTGYGRAYGMVFQMVDDMLDLTSTEASLGKPAGHDMVEGVYTLPVLPKYFSPPLR